ncbi:uncharacterized protein STEHIDRAFT_126111 [Stereum hirsutum FP-91666 SS1]|uniref:Uncharacterized protein n=1 Tax=Stereum hirsutum (strain FP-91666) TaxID=721885 RepID=R7RZ58_STEHR|nr:uncharacterized protein STEHIDRAFT_126111 [Stereum hirsutum FP-91666 SS1]EIM80118.1 hypothetical protein STEHIDRAFT_126111 [Stereum hirsutum FP-91666 SS1]
MTSTYLHSSTVPRFHLPIRCLPSSPPPPPVPPPLPLHPLPLHHPFVRSFHKVQMRGCLGAAPYLSTSLNRYGPEDSWKSANGWGVGNRNG